MSLPRVVRRVLNGMLPGRVKTVDDTGQVQFLQIDHGPQGPAGSASLHDKVPRLGDFGFFSNPPADSDVAVLCVGGDRGNAVVIATGHKASRIKNVPQGDAGIHDVRGIYVWLTANGPVIDAGGKNVTIQNAKDVAITASDTVTINASSSPGLIINGDVQVNGKLTATGDVKAGSISLESHVHGGVQAGSGNTAGPH